MELVIILLTLLFLCIVASLNNQIKKLKEQIHDCDFTVRSVEDRHVGYIKRIWTYQSDIKTDLSTLLNHLKLQVTTVPQEIVITKKKK